MNKVLKIILVLVVVLALAVAGLVVFTLSKLDQIVEVVVERAGSETLGTEVTMDSADISLRSGGGALYGLSIANPAGFETPYAFQLGEVSLYLDLQSVSAEEIVVNSVVVDGAQVTFEEKGGVINLQVLLDNVKRISEGKEPTPEEKPAPTEPKAEGPKLVIREFRFTNTQATLKSERLVQDQTMKIPDIVLSDIGQKGAGVTAAEASQQLLQPLITKILEASQDRILEEVKKKATDSLLKKLPFGKGG